MKRISLLSSKSLSAAPKKEIMYKMPYLFAAALMVSVLMIVFFLNPKPQPNNFDGLNIPVVTNATEIAGNYLTTAKSYTGSFIELLLGGSLFSADKSSLMMSLLFLAATVLIFNAYEIVYRWIRKTGRAIHMIT